MKPTQAVLQARLRTYAEALRAGPTSADAGAIPPESLSVEQQGAARAVSHAIDAAAETPADPHALRTQMNGWTETLTEAGVSLVDPMVVVRVYEAIDRVEGDREEDNL